MYVPLVYSVASFQLTYILFGIFSIENLDRTWEYLISYINYAGPAFNCVLSGRYIWLNIMYFSYVEIHRVTKFLPQNSSNPKFPFVQLLIIDDNSFWTLLFSSDLKVWYILI